MISCFDYVLRSLYERYFVEPENDLIKREQKELKCSQLMMGIKHLDEISYMRNLTTKDINKLICFRGIVIRSSEIYPEMKCAFFRCTECKY